MNLTEFLERRNQKNHQEADQQEARSTCYQCYRSKRSCVCRWVHPIPTRTKVLLLMHPMEARKETVGTGRPTVLCLPHSELLIGIDFTENPRVNALLADPQYVPMLLFPGKEARTIGAWTEKRVFDEEKIPLLIVLDATWPCARKMLRLSQNIQTLPQVTLAEPHVSNFRIKHQPKKHFLSTIETLYYYLQEATAAGLEQFEDRQILETLPNLLEEMVRFHIRCAEDSSLAGYRRRHFKKPTQRTRQSRTWGKHSQE